MDLNDCPAGLGSLMKECMELQSIPMDLNTPVDQQ